jgi:hypothetical protein
VIPVRLTARRRKTMSTVITPERRASSGSPAVGNRNAQVTANYLRLGLRVALGLSIAWQAVFAGQFLSGRGSALRLHEVGAYAVVLLAVITLIVELIAGWRRHRWTTAWLAGLLAIAIVAQLLLGFTSVRQAQALAYHIPLGVAIAGLYVYYFVQSGHRRMR